MQVEIAANREHLPNRVILDVSTDLDDVCALAIVTQATTSLRNGSEGIVVDLSKRKGLSLFGLAALVDRANEAGVLEKVAFHLSDSAIRRFCINLDRIRITLGAER